MEYKLCCVCDTNKPITEYYQASNNRGPMGACKTCQNKRNQNARIKYVESRRIARAEYRSRPEVKAKEYKNTLDMYKLYPEKQKARMKVYRAVRDGVLVRLPCESCGDSKVQAHHDDYTKPLEIRWVCRTHHNLIHKQMFA